jgi:hypothetical protein
MKSTMFIGSPGRFLGQIRRQLLIEFARIGEREILGRGVDEEVERIDHRHVGEEIHRHAEFRRRLGKYETREPVAVGILLPVHEMLGRRDLERIARNPGTAVRGGPQAHDLRAKDDRAVVAIARDVLEADQDRHADRATLLSEGPTTIKQIPGRRPECRQQG